MKRLLATILSLLLLTNNAWAPSIGSGSVGQIFSTTGLYQVSAVTVTGDTAYFTDLNTINLSVEGEVSTSSIITSSVSATDVTGTNVYVENLYGESPITVWDDIYCYGDVSATTVQCDVDLNVGGDTTIVGTLAVNGNLLELGNADAIPVLRIKKDGAQAGTIAFWDGSDHWSLTHNSSEGLDLASLRQNEDFTISMHDGSTYRALFIDGSARIMVIENVPLVIDSGETWAASSDTLGEALRVSAAGPGGGDENVGGSIGFTLPGRTGRKGAAIAIFQDGADPDVGGLNFYTKAETGTTGNLYLNTRITPGGKLLIGASNTLPPETGQLNVWNTVYVYDSSAGNDILFSVTDSSDDGILDVYRDNSSVHRLSGTLNADNYINNGGKLTIGGNLECGEITATGDCKFVDDGDINDYIFLDTNAGDMGIRAYSAPLAIETRTAGDDIIFKTDLTTELMRIDTDTHLVTVDAVSGTTVTANSVFIEGGDKTILDIRPSAHTGTANRVINMKPLYALEDGAHWTGFRIDGSLLDPDAVESRIRGIAVNMSGVDHTNEPEIDGLRIQVPADCHENCHAIHVNNKIQADWDITDGTSASNWALIDIIVDNEGATGGEFHAMDVAQSVTDTTVTALATHTGVDVIHQHVGSSAELGAGFVYDQSGGTYTDRTSEFLSPDSDIVIFVDDNDAIYLASETQYDEVTILLSTNASHDVLVTFEGARADVAAWDIFTPSDDTEGFTGNGTIRFDRENLPNWGTATILQVTGAGDAATEYYWIRITRTRNLLPTSPVESIIGLLSIDEDYAWDNLGNVTSNSVHTHTLSLHEITEPDNIPPANTAWLYLDTADNHLKIMWDEGTVETIETHP